MQAVQLAVLAVVYIRMASSVQVPTQAHHPTEQPTSHASCYSVQRYPPQRVSVPAVRVDTTQAIRHSLQEATQATTAQAVAVEAQASQVTSPELVETVREVYV